MPKILLAVVSCIAHRHRVAAQRETWMKDVPAHIDLRVFVGGVASKGEVGLDVEDGYEHLPDKVRAIFKWALDHGYDYVFRADSDIYLRPERLKVPVADYAGRVRGPAMGLPAPYCSGFSYWVSKKAMRLIVDTPFDCQAEDCMVGNVLLKHGIRPLDEGHKYAVVTSEHSAISYHEGPRKGNVVVAACEYKTAEEMKRAHHEFLHNPAKEVPQIPMDDPLLSRVDVLVKTFLRDGMLVKCVAGIRDNMKSARIVIVDDGDSSLPKTAFYERLKAMGHAVHWLPFDSGFGEKSNAAFPFYEREYVLIFSDDFQATEKTAEGVRKMVRFLDMFPQYSVVSGRVDNKPYEFDLEVKDGYCREVKAERKTKVDLGSGPEEVIIADLTVNFSLIRRSILGMDKIHWDGGEVKIGGGEHGAWYSDCIDEGIGVACIPSVNVNQIPFFIGAQDPRYPGYRARARKEGRPCLKKRGIDFYHCYGHKDPEMC